MALADIPAYGAFVQRRQMIEDEPLKEIQRASGALGLLANIQQQRDAANLRDVLASAGGDPEVAMQAALKTNNVKAAHELAPLVKLQQDRRQQDETRRGLAALLEPQQASNEPMELGIGQPVRMAGEDERAPTAAPTNRIDHLNRLAALYANNPVVVQRIQSEIDKIKAAADKPSQKRDRIQGDTLIQEEFVNGKWQEIGRGPRFARQVAATGGGTEDVDFTPDALELRARQYLSGDPRAMANLGRGAQGSNRIIQITNRAAELLREQGGSPEEIARRLAEFRANSNSLNKLTQSYDAVVAFEQTAVRNGKLLKELADKVDKTGIPVVERWIRAGRKEIAGDEDVAQFMAQLQVYRTEAARILTNPNLSGQLTDSARREVEEFMKPGASSGQIKKVVDLLERDFTNRKQTLEEQMRAIRGRLQTNRSAGEPATPSPAAPAAPSTAVPDSAPRNARGWRLMTDAKGNKAYVSPDGKQFEEVKQ